MSEWANGIISQASDVIDRELSYQRRTGISQALTVRRTAEALEAASLLTEGPRYVSVEAYTVMSRVLAFIHEREKASGLNPECIASINGVSLSIDDLLGLLLLAQNPLVEVDMVSLAAPSSPDLPVVATVDDNSARSSVCHRLCDHPVSGHHSGRCGGVA